MARPIYRPRNPPHTKNVMAIDRVSEIQSIYMYTRIVCLNIGFKNLKSLTKYFQINIYLQNISN